MKAVIKIDNGVLKEVKEYSSLEQWMKLEKCPENELKRHIDWKAFYKNKDLMTRCLPIYLKHEVVKFVSWPIAVEKGPFSIAITLRCRGGYYSFHWIATLTLDPYFMMLC